MMKHTNSGVPESDDLDDIEVIANDNTSVHEEKRHEFNELPEIQTNGNQMKNNNVHNKPGNIDRENYYVSKETPTTPVTKAKHYNKPILPKVLVALLVILLMAVIALSFVLYHIDQELRSNKDKTDTMFGTLTEDSEIISQLKKTTLGNNESLISIQETQGKNILHLIQKTNKNNMSLISMHERYIKDISYLTQKTKKNNQSLRAMQRKYNDGVSSLNKSTIKNKANIVAVEKDLKNDISGLKEKNVELNETTEQLDMYMQYKEHYKGKIGLSFEDVVKLTGKHSRVSKAMSHLVLLSYQFNQFTTKYEKQWGITYADVVRLTDEIDFKVDQPIPLLEKIDRLHRIFKQQFYTTWNITFNDVIRLTTKVDIKAMTALMWHRFKVNKELPPLLQKIEYMYEKFNNNYENKWNITFKEVISLTDKIDFKVNETIPILQKIDGWYFDGFQEIWGNGFPGYVNLMMSSVGIDRTDILKKLQHIKSQGTILKFLPGKFELNNGRLAVYGYVAIYKASMWGTINNALLQNKEANVICKTGKYKGGVYDKGKYNVGGMDRDSMKLWYGFLYCSGDEPSIEKCTNSLGNPWPHKKDAGVKCYF